MTRLLSVDVPRSTCGANVARGRDGIAHVLHSSNRASDCESELLAARACARKESRRPHGGAPLKKNGRARSIPTSHEAGGPSRRSTGTVMVQRRARRSRGDDVLGAPGPKGSCIRRAVTVRRVTFAECEPPTAASSARGRSSMSARTASHIPRSRARSRTSRSALRPRSTTRTSRSAPTRPGLAPPAATQSGTRRTRRGPSSASGSVGEGLLRSRAAKRSYVGCRASGSLEDPLVCMPPPDARAIARASSGSRLGCRRRACLSGA